MSPTPSTAQAIRPSPGVVSFTEILHSRREGIAVFEQESPLSRPRITVARPPSRAYPVLKTVRAVSQCVADDAEPDSIPFSPCGRRCPEGADEGAPMADRPPA